MGRTTEMLCQEAEELRYVAAIAIKSPCLHAPLGAEMAKPAGHFGGYVRTDSDVAHDGKSVTPFFTLP
jgi:hypothetical protein